MKVYQFIHEPDAKPLYRGTLADVKADAKEVATKLRFAIRIHELDVPTDKDSVIALLNTGGPPADLKPTRSWSVTPRGGLAELE